MSPKPYDAAEHARLRTEREGELAFVVQTHSLLEWTLTRKHEQATLMAVHDPVAIELGFNRVDGWHYRALHGGLRCAWHRTAEPALRDAEGLINGSPQ